MDKIEGTTEVTMIPNGVLRDERLSWEAKGLLVTLLSHSDGWQSVQGYATAGLVLELEERGYVLGDWKNWTTARELTVQVTDRARWGATR